jgi:hypothetical protein
VLVSAAVVSQTNLRGGAFWKWSECRRGLRVVDKDYLQAKRFQHWLQRRFGDHALEARRLEYFCKIPVADLLRRGPVDILKNKRQTNAASFSRRD